MYYKNAGVDIEAGYRSVELMKEHVKKTMLGEVLGGSLITETIFGRAGVGTVVQKAVSSQDVPVLLAAVVLSAAVFVMVNLVIDLLYPLLDPRLRVGKESR